MKELANLPNRVAVMMSGGLDSSVLVAALLKEGKDVTPICFDDKSYMQDKALIAIKSTLHYYKLQSKIVKIRMYAPERIKVTDNYGYVPGWKVAMQILAMAHCEHLRIDTLLTGYISDNAEYKDEEDASIEKVYNVYNDIYSTNIKVLSPFRHMTKVQIVNLAIELDFPTALAYSCGEDYSPPMVHCGRCEWCRRRKAAFAEVNQKDEAFFWE
ncbi:MAG: 7-cyano-7-deazaguanine synthase [Oligoflexales bacterium]|nr:7-cyano-7-deazaguanine synthase [Oligoflexales bacterium]